MEKLINNKFNNVMCIYKIVNKYNKKVYIGSTVNLKERINSHINNLIQNKHINNQLQNSWNASGKDNFYFEIVELIYDESFLPYAELYYIEKFRRENGVYNVNNPIEEYKLIKNRNIIHKNRKTKVDLTNKTIKEVIISEFDYMFIKLREKLNNNDECVEVSKISEFITKRITLKECDPIRIEECIIRVLRKKYDLSIFNFESTIYDRRILNKYGIYTYKRMILSKELGNKISNENHLQINY